jgi:hypothetical protein
MLEVVERLRLVAGRILDRAAHEPHPGRKTDRLCGGRRFVGKAPLEIGRDRQVGRLDDDARMRKRFVARDGAVAPAERAGARAARGRDRFEAEPGQDASAAAVPGVRDHEAALVKRLEARGLIGLEGHT